MDRNYIFADYKKGKSLKLLEGVEGIEFSFYGYDFIGRRYEWYNNFDGNRTKILPMSIIISYKHDGQKGKLVFGINVNSNLKMVYNDIYLRQ
jgi:hypothetical protein